MPLIVSFAGQIGSGKSSVSQHLAAKLHWPRAAFGDYLRKVAGVRGVDANDRKILQDLGQSLVSADSRGFCLDVLMDGGFTPKTNMLVDGIRHVGIQRDIAALVAPSISKLIYLGASETERLERVKSRPGGEGDFDRAEEHIVEAELRHDLPAFANAVIDAERELSLVLEACEQQIREWLSPTL